MTIPGMTGDTDPANPVGGYPANTFPIGAALTIAYGSNERLFCTLGNLYRILGYLDGDIPLADHINAAIERWREPVAGQLPDELKAFDPPPGGSTDTPADIVWLTGIIAKYGDTITLRHPKGSDTHE